MVISCTPQSLLAFGSGNACEIVEGRIERGAEEIGLALRQAVEASPEQIEIGARRRVDALRAAEIAARLVRARFPEKPRAARSAGVRQIRSRAARARRPGGLRSLRSCARSESEFGHGTGEQLGIVGAGERVQVGERKAAPRSAEHAQPRHAILRIEKRASKSEGVDDLRTVLAALRVPRRERGSRPRAARRRWARAICARGQARRRDTSLSLASAVLLVFRASRVDAAADGRE